MNNNSLALRATHVDATMATTIFEQSYDNAFNSINNSIFIKNNSKYDNKDNDINNYSLVCRAVHVDDGYELMTIRISLTTITTTIFRSNNLALTSTITSTIDR